MLLNAIDSIKMLIGDTSGICEYSTIPRVTISYKHCGYQGRLQNDPCTMRTRLIQYRYHEQWHCHDDGFLIGKEYSSKIILKVLERIKS